MARIGTFTFLSSVAAIAACGGSPTPARAPAPAAEPAPVAAAPQPAAPEPPPPEPEPEPEEPPPEPVTSSFTPKAPKVELLARGKGKRSPLRYQAAVGDPVDCTMVMDMSVSAAGATVAIPTTTMSWTGKVTLAEKRTLTTSAVVDQLDIAPGADPMSDSAGREIRTKLSPMLGGTMESEVTDRGITQKTSFTSRGPLDPQTAMGMQGGASGGLVFPEQPVGVGAKWRVTRVEEIAMVTTTTVATFEIVERTADRATIRGTIESTGVSAIAPPVKSTGTAEATFTGTLCGVSKTTTATSITAPTAMTIDMTLETRPRAQP
jgi:hypothetical protein